MGVTSSGWLDRPEQFWRLASKLGFPVEWYAVCRSLHLTPNYKPTSVDPRIGLDKFSAWGEKYGPVDHARVHGAVHYDVPPALKHYLWNSNPFAFLANPYEPGSWHDRWVATGFAGMTRTVSNGFATHLAEELGTILNYHVNIVEEAERRGEIGKLLGKSAGIEVENDVDYKRSDPALRARDMDPKRAVAAAEINDFKVIYGGDHAFEDGVDPVETLRANKESLKGKLTVIHVAGSRGERGLITDDDWQFWEFIEYIHNEWNEVAIFLDLSPKVMFQLSEDQQESHILYLTRRIER